MHVSLFSLEGISTCQTIRDQAREPAWEVKRIRSLTEVEEEDQVMPASSSLLAARQVSETAGTLVSCQNSGLEF